LGGEGRPGTRRSFGRSTSRLSGSATRGGPKANRQFLCECADAGCTETITVPPQVYEEVRTSPTVPHSTRPPTRRARDGRRRDGGLPGRREDRAGRPGRRGHRSARRLGTSEGPGGTGLWHGGSRRGRIHLPLSPQPRRMSSGPSGSPPREAPAPALLSTCPKIVLTVRTAHFVLRAAYSDRGRRPIAHAAGGHFDRNFDP